MCGGGGDGCVCVEGGDVCFELVLYKEVVVISLSQDVPV